jgi:exodeoxyribonuclease VII small subunit
MNKKNGQQPSFEKALEKLEEIVDKMEGGTLPLEKMMEQFEEGMRLIAFCTAKLNEVERKIEIMVKKGDKTVKEPFEAEKTNTEDVKREA